MMEILADFGMFAYNICKGFINLGVMLLTIYVFLYFLFRIVACGNSKSDYKQFRKKFNGTCMNYMTALHEISSVHLDSVKLWAEEKTLENKDRRRNRVYHQ